MTEYKLGDFFRNFIAVVLGIVLTFAGSDWLTERNTQKEVKNIVTDALVAVPEINHYLITNTGVDWDFLFQHWEAISLVNQIPQIQSINTYNADINIIDETIAAIDKECN